MSDFKDNVEKLNVRQIVLSSVMTAFGLVVALVWKDTIVATVDYLLPNTDDGTIQGMYISAIAVTCLVIILAKFAIKLNERVEKEIDRVQSYFEDDDEKSWDYDIIVSSLPGPRETILIGIHKLVDIKSKKFFIASGIMPFGISIPDEDHPGNVL